MLQIDLNQRFHSRGCLLNFEDDLFVVEGAIEPNAGAVEAIEEGSFSKIRSRKSQAPEEACTLPALSSIPRLKPLRPSLERIGA